jgi:hypothetical protein
VRPCQEEKTRLKVTGEASDTFEQILMTSKSLEDIERDCADNKIGLLMAGPYTGPQPPHGGQGESLVPPYTRRSDSLSLFLTLPIHVPLYISRDPVVASLEHVTVASVGMQTRHQAITLAPVFT